MAGSSASGCWKSPSSVRTTSPRAAASPALSAASLPKFRESSMYRTRHAGAAARTTSRVASRLPSFTTTISKRSLCAASASRSARSSTPAFSASFSIGTTAVIDGMAARACCASRARWGGRGRPGWVMARSARPRGQDRVRDGLGELLAALRGHDEGVLDPDRTHPGEDELRLDRDGLPELERRLEPGREHRQLVKLEADAVADEAGLIAGGSHEVVAEARLLR